MIRITTFPLTTRRQLDPVEHIPNKMTINQRKTKSTEAKCSSAFSKYQYMTKFELAHVLQIKVSQQYCDSLLERSGEHPVPEAIEVCISYVGSSPV